MQSPDPSRSARILVVDDDINLGIVLCFMIGRWANQVASASNGVQALEMLRCQSFDLVLTDLRMPQMDGLTLMRTLHESHPEMPVVLLTAYGDADTVAQATQAGAAGFLAKPVDQFTLNAVLKRTIYGRPNDSATQYTKPNQNEDRS